MADSSAQTPTPGTGTSRLLSATAVMASGTVVSRAFGMVRALLAAYLLGSNTRQSEIYAVSTMIPNSLYFLLAGGYLNAVLVPQIVRAIKQDKDGGEAYVNRIMTAFLLIVSALTVVFILLGPLLTGLYAGSDWHSPELTQQYRSMVVLTTLCLPQVFFYGAFFMGSQILNARDRFGPMMWAPVANNVIQILVLSGYAVVWGFHSDTAQAFSLGQVCLLGFGSVLGLACQTALLVPFMNRAGFHYRPRFDLKGTGLGRTLSLAKWTIGFVALNQLTAMITTRLLTGATAGGLGAGNAAYNNAYLIYILPHSLITVSIGTALLPSLSRLAADRRQGEFARELMRGLKLTTAATGPIALLLVATGGPIATMVYRGADKGGDLVGWTLMALGLGLVPFGVQYLVLRGFFAVEDTRSTFLLQIVVAGLIVAGTVLLIVLLKAPPRWVAPSLGLASSFAYSVGSVVSWRRFRRWAPRLKGGHLIGHLVRVLLCALPGAGLAGLVTFFQTRLWSGLIPDFLGLVTGFGLALGVYLVMARLLHLTEVSEVVAMIGRRLLPKKEKTMAVIVPPRKPQPDPDRPGGSAVPTSDGSATPGRPGPVVPPPAAGGASAARPEAAVPPGRTSGPAGSDLAASGSIPAGPRPVDSVPADSGPVDSVPFDSGPVDSGPVGPGPLGSQSPDGPSPAPDQVAADDPTEAMPAASAAPVARASGLFDPTDSQPVLAGLAPLVEGALVAQRYRLRQFIGRQGQVGRWRADDETLSRPVLVQAIEQEESADAVIATARLAADVTDARFVRVLDAVADGNGFYIVSEWIEGVWLSDLLRAGPLTAIESAWIVREVAQPLSAIHPLRLCHGRLTPARVLVTASGQIRVAGLMTDAVLDPLPGDEFKARADQEAEDVTALGRLLYACLTGLWPGSEHVGLPLAPAGPHGPEGVLQVRPGASAALERIVDQIISPSPRGGLPRLVSADQVLTALNGALGSADAAADLAHRLTGGDRPVRLGAHVNAGAAIPPVIVPATPTAPAGAGPAGPPAAAAEAEDAEVTAPVEDAPEGGRGARPGRPPRGRSIGLLVLVGLVVLGLLTAIVMALYDHAQDQPSGDLTAAPPRVPLTIQAVRVFDPEADGGNSEENDAEVAWAWDGDPSTAWRTVIYHHTQFGRFKDGLGLVLDFGSAVDVSNVNLTLTNTPTPVKIMVPTNGDTVAAPMDTIRNWTALAASPGQSAQVDISFQTQRTRFLLIYFYGALPEVAPDDYQTGLVEITCAT
ncbi:MAG: murein biosynthesis integral membrane protein MurJ [Propionibacteriaceae bacterium]|jgi:putative peptidoglycan lipid II flippase|nr:murein biosynthesis integral membrane protein MurJ [Propionibacteriaceae bacterium]